MDSVDESGVRSIQPEKNTTLFCFIGSLHPTNTPRIFPAQRSRDEKNLTTKTRRREEILCDSSRLRLFVVNRMSALPGERREILSSLWCCSEDERGFEVERHENHRSVVAVCGRRGRYCAEQAAGASVAHQG